MPKPSVPLARPLLFFFALAVVFLAIYFLAEWFYPNGLGSPKDYLKRDLSSALLSVAVMASDLFLPIPSSVLMTMNGAVFGVTLGASISLVGSLIGVLLGYVLGGSFSGLNRKWLSERDLKVCEKLMLKWGVLAIALSRPLPILSECMSIFCGLTKVPLRKCLLASFVGYLAPSLIYASAGVFFKQADLTIFVFLGVLLLSGTMWFVAKSIASPSATS